MPLKKPAAAAMSLKRPATAMGALNKSLADMQRGSKKAKTPEDDCHDDPNVDKKSEKSDDDDDHRDKGKAIKFRQMQKDLPPHIVDLYEKEALNKSSPRAFRTQLINQLFTKLPNGRYKLNDDKPMFRDAKSLYEKSVMKGLYFGNSDNHMDNLWTTYGKYSNVTKTCREFMKVVVEKCWDMLRDGREAQRPDA